jgi:peptide/nickel transport system permease protein
VRLLARRAGFYLLTAWVALTVNFILPRLVPGDPVATAIANASQAGLCNKDCVHAIQLQFGLHSNTPVLVQYLEYWRDLLHGNLGTSWFLGNQPVGTLLGQYLPWTLGLLGVSTLLAFLLGTLLGVALGWLRGSWLDWVLPGATFFQAIPYFFLALVLLMVFGTVLHWFPIGQGYDIYGATPGLNWPFLSSVVDHGALPAATIVLASIAGWILGMRNMMVITMDEDFVLVRGTQRPPAQHRQLRARHQPRGRRPAAGRDRLQLPRRRVPALPGGAQQRLSAGPGHLRRHNAGGAGRQPSRGRGLRPDRPPCPPGGVTMKGFPPPRTPLPTFLFVGGRMR